MNDNKREVLFQGEDLQISVTDDGMEAYLTAAQAINLEPFLALLGKLGISHGIIPEALREALANPNPEVEVLFAKGTPMVQGISGSITYTVRPEDICPAPKIGEDGKVDMRNLRTVYSFRQGDVLAELTPHTLGSPGETVTGKIIPAVPGNPITISLGKGTALDKDRRTLVAAVDGALSFAEGIPGIFPVFTTKGDVDYSVGNIEFVGTVVVKGDVLSGFKVKSAADVSIDGIVEAAQITAGNHIVVKGGVQGGGRALLEAGGNVHARFLCDAKIRVKKIVEVRGSIMRCDVIAGEEIRALGNDGEIVGGKHVACYRIQATKIGASLGIATSLEVGTDPNLVLRLESLHKLVDDAQKKMVEHGQRIHELRQVEQQFGKLHTRSRLELAELTAAFTDLKNGVDVNKAEIELLEKQLQAFKGSTITADSIMYPGVTIRIGKRSFTVAEIMRSVRFSLQGDKIRVTAI